MLKLGLDCRIWLYGPPCDMRRSFDGLSALVRHELGGDPSVGKAPARTSRPLAPWHGTPGSMSSGGCDPGSCMPNTPIAGACASPSFAADDSAREPDTPLGACCVAVPGTTTRGTCAPRTATGTPPGTGTTTTGFVWPARSRAGTGGVKAPPGARPGRVMMRGTAPCLLLREAGAVRRRIIRESWCSLLNGHWARADAVCALGAWVKERPDVTKPLRGRRAATSDKIKQ